MKTLEEMYDELEEKHIEVKEIDFGNKLGCIVSYKDNTTIILNKPNIANSKQEKRVIAEEKAHYDIGAMYPLDTPRDLVGKLEYKAIKRMYNEHIPHDELKKLYYENCSLNELSEHFGMPIEDIILADFFYKNVENYDLGGNLYGYE